jgi:putative addiction module killer protein
MELREYVTENGRRPYTEWLLSLKDVMGRARIHARVDRLARGLLGDCKMVRAGVWELRVHSGPGYRVYFGMENDEVVLLLCGGDKSSQVRDIERAAAYWQDYKQR